jgi:mRNA-degrading endonuclease HigB of HigAB toxin-antitoxin module
MEQCAGSQKPHNACGENARLQYPAQVLAIRFFGTHSEYDEIDAETV